MSRSGESFPTSNKQSSESGGELNPVELVLSHNTLLKVSTQRAGDGIDNTSTFNTPTLIMENRQTGATFDLNTLLPKNHRFVWGTQWRRSRPGAEGLVSEIEVPDAYHDHELANGREFLLALLHEIGHSKRDPVEGLLLHAADFKTFRRIAEGEYGLFSPQYANALKFEFIQRLRTERNAWAEALRLVKIINEKLRTDVIDMHTADVRDFIHGPKALESHMESFRIDFEKHGLTATPVHKTLEDIMRDINKDKNLQRRCNLIERLSQIDLRHYGLKLESFVFELDKFDDTRLVTILDEIEGYGIEKLTEEERIRYARSLNSLLPSTSH